MKLKKLIALLTVLVMAVSCLTSCAESTTAAPAGTTEAGTTAEPAEENTAEPAAEGAEEATTTDLEDPIVITVGDTVYRKSEVQELVDYYMSSLSDYYTSNYGYTLDTTDASVIRYVRDTVCNYLVEDAVKTQHAVALGVSELTDDETLEVQNEYWNYFYYIASMFGITDSATMQAYSSVIQQYVYQYYGVTYSGLLNEKLQEKLENAATADVTVTEEQIQAAYEEQVESDRTGAGASASSYDNYTSYGYTVAWRPEGMRYVKNLLVMFNDADSTYMSAVSAKVSEEAAAMTTASAGIATDTDLGDLDALTAYVAVTVTVAPEATATDAEATATDVDAKTVPVYEAAVTDTFPASEDETVLALYQAVRDYVSAKALNEAYAALYDEATAEALAAIDARADEALAKLDAGEDWDTVMAEYTDDTGMAESAYGTTGYLVYEGKSFDPAFLNAALALENVGDYTGKIAGSYGYYIIQYTSSVEPGAVPLEEIRDTVEANALSDAKDAAYTALVEQWVADAGAVVDYGALD